MNITNFMPARVISGKGCLIANSGIFSATGKRALIVTGKKSAILSGALKDVTEILKASNIEYRIFDSVEPNPQTKTCHFGGFTARAFGADFVIGIGGGSVMDAAKAVAIYAKNPQLSDADIYKRTVPSEKLPVILVGTTAGTGSEVTGVSVLTLSESGLKKSISGADCYADISFCDYSYTVSTSKETRISASLDAFSHAVESYFASTANDMSSLYALKALELLSDYICNCRFGDLEPADYEKLYTASLFAGYAINISGTCFPHTVGYCLTEEYNIPHGKACSYFFPLLLKKAKKNCPERIGTILKAMSCDENKLIGSIAELTDVKIEISKESASRIAERWKSGIKNFDRTPGGFSADEAVDALISSV